MTKNKQVKISIKSVEGGWIVEENKSERVFFRWEPLIWFLEEKLTSKGDEND